MYSRFLFLMLKNLEMPGGLNLRRILPSLSVYCPQSGLPMHLSLRGSYYVFLQVMQKQFPNHYQPASPVSVDNQSSCKKQKVFFSEETDPIIDTTIYLEKEWFSQVKHDSP